MGGRKPIASCTSGVRWGFGSPDTSYSRNATPPLPSIYAISTSARTCSPKGTRSRPPVSRVTLIFLAYRLAALVFYSQGHRFSELQVEVKSTDLSREASDRDGSRVLAVLEAERQAWTTKLPEDGDKLLAWMLVQSHETLLNLLAFCTASTLNAVRSDEKSASDVDTSAEALGLDLADWWTPTGPSYLTYVPKARILAALADALPPIEVVRFGKMKKAELVEAAERALDGKRWLPTFVRRTTAEVTCAE